MDNENMELEEFLSRRPLPEPTDGLRQKVLTAARLERRRARWSAVRHLCAVAVVLLMVIVGVRLERAEMAVGKAFLANRMPSRAEREAEELMVALTDMLNGNGLAENIRRRLQFSLSASRQAPDVAMWHRKIEQELNMMKED